MRSGLRSRSITGDLPENWWCSDSDRAAYATLFSRLAEMDGPALFHCTAGKDRTGWAAAALLELLDVDREVILEDYLRSSEPVLASFRVVFERFAAAGGDPDVLIPVFAVLPDYLGARPRGRDGALRQRRGLVHRGPGPGAGTTWTPCGPAPRLTGSGPARVNAPPRRRPLVASDDGDEEALQCCGVLRPSWSSSASHRLSGVGTDRRLGPGRRRRLAHVRLRGNGTVQCWGANFFGQLGDGTTTLRPRPVTVADSPASSPSLAPAPAPDTPAPACRTTPQVLGGARRRQLGDGTTSDRLTPVTVSGLTGVLAISVGRNHTCARLSDNTARCWGSNDWGQLGDGTTTQRRTPVTVSGLTGVVAISAGWSHMCARLSDNTARCWGSNGRRPARGRHHDGSADPSAVSGLTGVANIALGNDHTCARLSDNTAKCWGRNVSASSGTAPRQTGGPSDGQRAHRCPRHHCRLRHTCARLSNNTARCWGLNGDGQTRGRHPTDRRTPVTVRGLTGVLAVTAGSRHTCARVSNNTAKCWGRNAFGQLRGQHHDGPTDSGGGQVDSTGGSLGRCGAPFVSLFAVR